MTDTDELAALKEGARAEIELLGEVRRNAFEQFSHSFRWLTASLLAINGGAAIATLNADNVSAGWKVVSGACFVGGILAALLVGVLAQRANIRSFLPIQRQVGYWMGVASDGIRDEEQEQLLATEGAPALRLSKFGQAMGWLSALLFVAGLATIATDLLQTPEENNCKAVCSGGHRDGRRSEHDDR